MARMQAYPDLAPTEVEVEVLQEAFPPGWTLHCIEFTRGGRDHFEWFANLDERSDGRYKKQVQNRQWQVVLGRAWLEYLEVPVKWDQNARMWVNDFE